MAYWLMKSEPAEFSIDDLERRGRAVEPWGGVRNYQARNLMRDGMRKGDLAFFYHSSCEQPAIAGIMEIASPGYADPSQFDPHSKYHDAGSTLEAPRWVAVDVRFKRRLRRPVTLDELRRRRALAKMPLLRRGNRLSVLPVTKKEWDYILELEKADRRRRVD